MAARGGGARGRTVFSSSVRLTGGPDFFTCLAMLALALPERASNRRRYGFVPAAMAGEKAMILA